MDSPAALDTQVVAACSQADTPSAAADTDMPLVAVDNLAAGRRNRAHTQAAAARVRQAGAARRLKRAG